MIAATRYPAFSRNFEDEQDYAEAAVSAARKANPLPSGLSLAPTLRWKRELNRGSKLNCKTLVVGFDGGGASFAQKCFGLAGDADWIGTVVLPGAPSPSSVTGGLGDSLDPADPLNSACNIFLKKGGGEGSGISEEVNGSGSVSDGDKGNGESTISSNGAIADTTAGTGSQDSGVNPPPLPAAPTDAKADSSVDGGGGGVVVVLCGYCVPPRQADAWAKALLAGIDAEVVVALATVAAEPGRSEGWHGARLIATAEAEEKEECLKMSVGFQPLPTPTMLSGAPAALLSYCQRRGRAAMCFAAAELPGRRRALPQQQQLGLGAGVGGGVGVGSSSVEVLAEERSLSCTRKPLGLVAGGAMVSGGAGVGGKGAKTEIDAVDSATRSLYI